MKKKKKKNSDTGEKILAWLMLIAMLGSILTMAIPILFG